MKKWYALKIIIGKEELLEKALRNAGFEVFNPKYQLLERKSGRWITKEKYLLSGYLLIKAEMTAEVYHQLKNMWYILYPLAGTVTEDEIAYMRNCTDLAQTSAIEYSSDGIIYSGAIKDKADSIIKVDKRKRRVLISFDLGGETIFKWLPVKIISGNREQ